MVQFKTKCTKCKINYVTVTNRNAYGAVCFECDKALMTGELNDPVLKKMLDIPEELYQKSGFLRSIKINALKYGKLSEKQIEFFKKVVGDLTAKTTKAQVKPAEEPVAEEKKKPVAKAKKKKS